MSCGPVFSQNQCLVAKQRYQNTIACSAIVIYVRFPLRKTILSSLSDMCLRFNYFLAGNEVKIIDSNYCVLTLCRGIFFYISFLNLRALLFRTLYLPLCIAFCFPFYSFFLLPYFYYFSPLSLLFRYADLHTV